MPGDEPRRSGRATKGQHKTLEDEAKSTPKIKKTVPSKKVKKTAQQAEEDDEEEGEETIRCICGDNDDDEAGRKFIACDACQVWQHNVCMGVSLEDDEQPEHYFCEQCRPEEHKDLLDAIAKGEKPWEERQKASKGKKKGVKRGRKSSAKAGSEPKADTPEATSEPPTSQDSGNKRKFEEEAETATNGHAQASTVTPRADKKRKSVAKPSAENDPSTSIVDINSLPKDRKNVAIALIKIVTDGIDERVKAGSFRLPKSEDASAFGQRLGQLIEYELYMNHAEGGKGLKTYGEQFRMINANIKKNVALFDRLLRKSLTPAELATMSSSDMASEELQREREKLKEEADKQAVMIQEEEKPRVRRTHKGDEYVDQAGTGGNESVSTYKPVRRRESEMDVDGAASPGGADGNAGSPSAPRPSVSVDRRKSSQSFDINNVWSKTAASPDTERGSAQFPPRPARQNNEQGKPTGDADIDRLLADDDADDTYSPADAKPTASGIIWQGQLLQPGVTQLTCSARFIAGNDFSRYVAWSSFLPTKLEIEGRLERGKADDYMCGLQWSRKSDVSVLVLSPFDDRAAFDVVFEYFHSRKRYAVGKKGHGASDLIKDLYISPVDKGEQPPPHINLLDFCGLTFPTQERLLLLTIVVNKPSSWDQADTAMPAPPPGVDTPSSAGAHAARMSLPGPAASPINANGAGFSSALGGPPHGSSSSNGMSQGAFPPNPYDSSSAREPNLHHGQQQQQQPPQVAYNATAAYILGPYIECPVAQQILLATQGQVQETEATNMRDIFDREPRSRDDMSIFSAVLQANAKR